MTSVSNERPQCDVSSEAQLSRCTKRCRIHLCPSAVMLYTWQVNLAQKENLGFFENLAVQNNTFDEGLFKNVSNVTPLDGTCSGQSHS